MTALLILFAAICVLAVLAQRALRWNPNERPPPASVGGFSICAIRPLLRRYILAIRHLIFNTIENVVHIHPHVSKLSGFHIHIKIKRSPAKT